MIALESINSLLNQVITQSGIEYFLFGRDLRILFANEAALANLGYTLEELSQFTLMDICNRHFDKELVRLKNATPVTEDNVYIIHLSNTYYRKDGTAYPGDTKLQQINHEGKLAFMATVRDVSEREQALDQLNMVIEGGVKSVTGIGTSRLKQWKSVPGH